jgi:GT2 family glycosyltransferase
MSNTPDHLTSPTVRAVVVNHNGGDRTLACIAALERTDWPADRLELVLVDNASTDGSAARVEREHPRVRILRSERNFGFAGGANRGLRQRAGIDHVALVNPDAFVRPGWLSPLVDRLAHDEQVGAACPKILLTGRYAELAIESPTRRRGRGDRRALGVRLTGVTVDGHDVGARTRFVSGTWGPEPGGRWTDGDGRLRVPTECSAPPPTGAVRLDSEEPVTVVLRSGGSERRHEVGPEPAWYAFELAGAPVALINNVGNVLVEDAYGADRGWLQPDDGDYDDPVDVFAWCGGAVLLRGSYLDDVGIFDERLFLYCEDLELSWRGRDRGWRYHTVPSSVVDHEHAASTIEGSALSDHYNQRNHLLVVTRHAAGGTVARIWSRYLAVTASYVRRDVLSHWMRGKQGSTELVGRRLGAFVGALLRVPIMLGARRGDARRTRNADRSHPSG